MLTDPIFYAAALPAVVILGLAKGGFSGIGILAVPLMALVAPPVQAASILLPILIVQDVVSVWAFRRTWDGPTLAVMLPGAALGIAGGWALAAYVSSAAVELAVGVTSVAFALLRLAKERGGAVVPAAPGSTAAGAFWGVVTGFTSQIAHAGGPPFQIHVMPKRLPRDVFIGTGALFFGVVNWLKVPAYLALDQFTAANLATSAVLAPAAVLSTWAGVVLVRRVPGERFYTFVYAVLVLVGAKLAWDGAAGLA
ncbi:MAG TPA: sulfite exporter TauE/SafE family protein [Azospirillaceae bacterium]|nr:sulfite exporter TauE/SafE family protein [Azospirillaceae bacterium]